MSRSYKKTYQVVRPSYGPYRLYAKRSANKKVRRAKDVPNGKAYRKLFCTWEIYDYSWWHTPKESMRRYRERLMFWESWARGKYAQKYAAHCREELEKGEDGIRNEMRRK